MHTDENRTIEQVEQDMEQVRVRLDELREEQAEIAAKLSGATNDSALLEAALEGKSPTNTQRVGKLQARADEIVEMVRVLEARALRLNLKRTDLLVAQAEQERAQKSEAAAAEEERFRVAQDALTRARNEAAWAQEHLRSLGEQRQRLERRLYESDAAYREEMQREAERRRQEAQPSAEEVERYRRQYLEQVAGVHVVDSPEEEAALREAAAREGVGLTVLGRKGESGDE